MKKIARITTFILACAMMLSLCACSSEKKTKKEGKSTDKKIEVKDDSEIETEPDAEFATEGRPYANFKDLKVKVRGKVITMGESTVQDLVNSGCYVNPRPLKSYTASVYSLSQQLEEGQLVFMTVFDMDEEEKIPEGQNANCPMAFLAKAEQAGPVTDCVVCGVGFFTEDLEVWENEVEFEFPFTLTYEELAKDSGEAASIIEGTEVYRYLYEIEDCSMTFSFDKNTGTLRSVVGEYDAGAIIDDRNSIESAY